MTAQGWDRFADHRQRQSDLVVEHGAGTLAVLGAGNCNDLDLERVAAVAAKLMLRAPIDLSGALAELPRLRGKSVSPAEMGALCPGRVHDARMLSCRSRCG